MEQQQSQSQQATTIDESQEFGFGPLDVVLGVLTLPLLFWALMYAVTGHERLYATRAARLRLYLVLLAVEVVLVAAIVWWVAR
jgi:hypothetical protein